MFPSKTGNPALPVRVALGSYHKAEKEAFRQSPCKRDTGTVQDKTHKVENRIVSLSQPYIRPIVRGKTKSPVEFGAKYDVSIDENGHTRLERINFNPYNESTVFIDAINGIMNGQAIIPSGYW